MASAGPHASLHLPQTENRKIDNHSVFLQGRCPSCRPTNSIKALKALNSTPTIYHYTITVHRTRKQKCKVKYVDIAVRSLTCHTATVTDMPCRITQCYLPPDRGDIPAFTPAEAGIRLSNPRGRQVDRVGLLHTEMV